MLLRIVTRRQHGGNGLGRNGRNGNKEGTVHVPRQPSMLENGRGLLLENGGWQFRGTREVGWKIRQQTGHKIIVGGVMVVGRNGRNGRIDEIESALHPSVRPSALAANPVD